MPEFAKTLDVLVAGELYSDQIMSGFDFWPQPGQEAFAREFHREVGGGASNTACALAKLGSRTAVLGVVGFDDDWLVQQLERRAVDASYITRHPTEPTGFTVAISTPQDRSFFTYAGANRAFPAALALAAAEGRLRPARHVHLAFAPDLATAPELLASLHACGCTVSLDVGWHEPWLRDPRVRHILPLLDLFFPNESEARALTGEADPAAMLRWFSSAGLSRVAVKLGTRGASLLWDRTLWEAPAPTVTPIDPTGAGDCFDAGFLHSWLRGDSPETCLQAGNICGALSTQAFGGVAGVPDPEHFNQLLKAYPCEK